MNFKNLALGYVSTAPSPATKGTSLVLGSGEGARFPQPSTDGDFYVTAMPPGENPHVGNSEILKVTARSTDTLTIVREQGDTSAQTIEEGWIILQSIYKENILDENDMASDSATALVTQQSVKAMHDTGWTAITETLTYASATTITVAAGAASRYQKGDKLKLTQTIDKYFYIIDVADELLTVTGGNDYTLVNAAITSPQLSRIENPFGFPPGFNLFSCGKYLSSNLSLANEDYTTITWNASEWDYGEMHNTSTNPEMIYAKVDGVYSIFVHLRLEQGSGRRIFRISKNGATLFFSEEFVPITAYTSSKPFATSIYLSAGDYISCQIYQNSGGTLTLSGGSFASLGSKIVVSLV
jgi:hypothetical protein